MKTILFLILLITSNLLYSQSYTKETIKFTILFDKNEPAKMMNVYVKNSNPPIGTTSDLNGYAVLQLKNEKQTIEISAIGPSMSFDLIKPLDSIFVNFNKRKIIFYYKGKRIKKVKPKTYAN